MLTGPLPELIDHRKMAGQAGILKGSVPVQQFTRLREMLEAGDGDVHLKLAFSKGGRDRTHVTGVVTARVELICQNCLTRYGQEIGSNVKMDIFPSEESLKAAHEAEHSLEQSVDGLVCPGKLARVVDLVEDELLLAVPMIPRHDAQACPDNNYEAPAETIVEPVDDRTTYRPFADLAKAIDDQNDSER